MADVQSAGHERGAGLVDRLNVEDATRVMEQAKAAVGEYAETAATFIRERPIVCLAGAVALGYLIGKIASH